MGEAHEGEDTMGSAQLEAARAVLDAEEFEELEATIREYRDEVEELEKVVPPPMRYGSLEQKKHVNPEIEEYLLAVVGDMGTDFRIFLEFALRLGYAQLGELLEAEGVPKVGYEHVDLWVTDNFAENVAETVRAEARLFAESYLTRPRFVAGSSE